jgi:hypothetical protein
MAQIPLIRRLVMTSAIRTVDADETILDVELDKLHDYALEWKQDEVNFFVDGRQVLHSESVPPAPLGFVAWIDNQYAVASTDGGFRFGVLPTREPQALTIMDLQINDKPLALHDGGDA